MTINVDAPVWVTGVIVKATRNSVKIRAYDKTNRPKDVKIARAHILEERDTINGGGFDFKVPQWVAYQSKLAYRKG